MGVECVTAFTGCSDDGCNHCHCVLLCGMMGCDDAGCDMCRCKERFSLGLLFLLVSSLFCKVW